MRIMGASTGTKVRGIVQQRRKSLFGQQSFDVCKISEVEKEGEKWTREEWFLGGRKYSRILPFFVECSTKIGSEKGSYSRTRGTHENGCTM